MDISEVKNSDQVSETTWVFKPNVRFYSNFMSLSNLSREVSLAM